MFAPVEKMTLVAFRAESNPAGIADGSLRCCLYKGVRLIPKENCPEGMADVWGEKRGMNRMAGGIGMFQCFCRFKLPGPQVINALP